MNETQFKDYMRLAFDEVQNYLSSEMLRNKAFGADFKVATAASFHNGVAEGMADAQAKIDELRIKLGV